MNGRPAKGRKPTKKEATIKEKLLRRIKEYEFNWLQIPFAIFFISLIWIVTYTPKESAPTPKKKGIESFIGYDPSRDISEISHIDYTNGAIEYRLPDNPGHPKGKDNAALKRLPSKPLALHFTITTASPSTSTPHPRTYSNSSATTSTSTTWPTITTTTPMTSCSGNGLRFSNRRLE